MNILLFTTYSVTVIHWCLYYCVQIHKSVLYQFQLASRCRKFVLTQSIIDTLAVTGYVFCRPVMETSIFLQYFFISQKIRIKIFWKFSPCLDAEVIDNGLWYHSSSSRYFVIFVNILQQVTSNVRQSSVKKFTAIISVHEPDF